MPLDSDVGNADAQLHVEFYTYNRTTPEHLVGVPFVKIMVPGDKTQVFDQPAKDHHKERFPRQWLHFQMQNGDAPVMGTSIATWTSEDEKSISQSQAQELSILKFQTVEQVAMASDSQLQRVGMGGLALRLAAQQYLRNKNTTVSERQVAELQQTNATLLETLTAMQAQLNELSAAQNKRGPGRPPKEAE